MRVLSAKKQNGKRVKIVRPSETPSPLPWKVGERGNITIATNPYFVEDSKGNVIGMFERKADADWAAHCIAHHAALKKAIWIVLDKTRDLTDEDIAYINEAIVEAELFHD